MSSLEINTTTTRAEFFDPHDRLTRGVQISQGLDRLKIGFYVGFKLDLLFDVLADAKRESQENRQLVPVVLGPDENYHYNCHPTGKRGGYAFHIQKGDVNVFISTRKDWMKTPNVLIDIGSSSCWAPGVDSTLHFIKMMLALYSGQIHKNSVSEVHICADFIGLDIESLELNNYDKWITRANKFDAYSDRTKFTGITLRNTEDDDLSALETGISVGKGDLMLRIYDKVFEMKKNESKQSLFASVWGKKEFDEESVTRVEFQLRKNVLKQFMVKTLEDLYRKLSGLWGYCTYEWARFCQSSFDRKNRHQDRAIIHPWWKKVQQLKWGKNIHVNRKKPLSLKGKKQLSDVMGGCALNLAAIGGIEANDTEAIKVFLSDFIEEWCEQKSKNINEKTGKNELQEKMQQKINEVWPYGFGEVHGPTEFDAERGYLS